MLRISMVTLGVKDVAAASRFYEAFGLTKSPAGNAHVAFFQLGPSVLGLFGREPLLEDSNAESVWTGNGGITLSRNLPSEAEVDALIAKAEAIGAKILKAPQKAFWGGYHGFFADLDGHVWEVAYNPFLNLGADGVVSLP
jgi:uncharacterized protein